MTRVLSALVALVLFAVPATALAASVKTNAPPGNSAIDEYLETVPSATGSAAPKPPSPGAASTALTAAQRARLQRLGPDGRALANAVDATSSVGPKVDKSHPVQLAASGRSPVGQLLDAVVGRDGGGGMGALLPLILLASLLGVVTLAVLRRRSAS